MSSLIIFALMIVSGTSSSLSSKEREIETFASLETSSNDLDFAIEDPKRLSRSKNDDSTGNDVENRVKNDDEENSNATESPDDQNSKMALKKGRKHKAYFRNYPFIPRTNRKQQMMGNYEKNAQTRERVDQRKKLSNRKKYQQESQIYYIKLPPTPYTYVPGYGYISQPPTYSSPGLQRPAINHLQKPLRPQTSYEKPMIKNPFIKVPVDFVSNGKPTGVYQWPAKRRESTFNRLDKGPYAFNGRPTSLYLLNSNGRKTGHQPIRLQDPSNEAYY